MPTYTVIDNIDLFRILPTAAAIFTWGDGTKIKRCILEKIVASSGNEYESSSWEGLGRNFFLENIYEFPDDKTATLWFKLNY